MKRMISMLLIALLALTGCQMGREVPTAESEADRLIAQAQSAPPSATLEKREQPAEEGVSPLYAQLGAPERFAPEVDAGSDKVSIEVDAKVVLPDVEGLPVVKVRPAQFSQETVSALFELFCGDTVMYDTSASGFTREGIIANMELYQSWTEREDFGDLKEEGKGMLALMERELAEMPEDMEELVSSAELREMVYSFFTPDLGRYMGVSAMEKPGAAARESNGKHFLVRNDFHIMDWEDHNVDFGPETGARINYYDEDTNDRIRGQHSFTLINGPEDVPQGALDALGMSPDEAAALVRNAIEKAGLELAVDKVYLNTIREYSTIVVDGVEHHTEPSEDSPTHYAYVVTLGQMMGGVATRTVTEAEGNNGKNVGSMEPSWFYQNIRCDVYDGEIQGFSWQAPMETAEVVAKNAALLPFEEIAGVFDAMMKVEYDGAASDADLLGLDIKVNRVELEMQRITPDGSVTEGLLVPVWNFYGETYYNYSWGGYGSNDTMDLPEALLTINAIDGSVIDIFQGY